MCFRDFGSGNTRILLQSCDEARDLAHSLVDAVAVLQCGGVAVKLLGQAVKVRKAVQQIPLTGLPQLRVAHKTLNKIQPGMTQKTATLKDFFSLKRPNIS